MTPIIAYQFSGGMNLFTEDDSDPFWVDGCRLRLLLDGIPTDTINPIIARWTIKLK